MSGEEIYVGLCEGVKARVEGDCWTGSCQLRRRALDAEMERSLELPFSWCGWNCIRGRRGLLLS